MVIKCLNQNCVNVRDASTNGLVEPTCHGNVRNVNQSCGMWVTKDHKNNRIKMGLKE